METVSVKEDLAGAVLQKPLTNQQGQIDSSHLRVGRGSDSSGQGLLNYLGGAVTWFAEGCNAVGQRQ